MVDASIDSHHLSMGHAALRRGRWSMPRHVYFVTFTTFSRRRLFDTFEVAATASRAVTTNVPGDARLLAWVLMPDHWHGLIRLGDLSSLADVVAGMKGRSARMLGRDFPAIGRVWATGYHDRAMRVEDDIVAAARYLIANPLRAQLAERAGNYPYWNAVWLDGAEVL